MASKNTQQEFRGICHYYSDMCYEGGGWAFWDERFMHNRGTHRERWDFKGMHQLKNGDHLTVYSPKNPKRSVWSGKISFRKHPDKVRLIQRGVNRKTWAKYFQNEYPAKLVPA